MIEKARTASCFVVFGVMLLVSACVTVEPVVTALPVKIEEVVAPKEEYHAHTVSATGETLSMIARWYTGSGNNWTTLLEVNPALDPQHIHIGDTVLIPDRLMQNRQPMPEGYGKAKPAKKKKIVEQRAAPAPAPVPAPVEVEVELFGPVDNETRTAQAAAPLPLETIE